MVASINKGRDVKEFNKQYAQGKNNEKIVKAFLISQGFYITNPSLEEDKFEDIDVWVGNMPVSIKAQHKSLVHSDPSICFELEQRLTGTLTWEKSWYYNGKAEKYLIFRGTELMLVAKAAIQEYVETKGWDKVRSLGSFARSYVGGSYRYDDARSGLIRYPNLPVEKRWTVPESLINPAN